jgi:hypothetical protein
MSDDVLIMIVVGSSLHAEVGDRPTAYRLARRVEDHLGQIGLKPDESVRCLVCSDLWYLNDAPLRRCPTISLGGPNRNALTAYLRDKVPSAFAIDGSLLVQVDLSYGQLDACCWGADDGMTAQAVDAFCERYLPQFVDAAASRLA